MKSFNRQQTQAVKVPRTRRGHPLSVLTSMPAGRMVPLAVVPMLREDSASAAARVQVEMLETKEILMNPVTCRVMAYVVPWLAMQRFEGSRDQFDRSYKKEPQVEGGDVVPFFETQDMDTDGAKEVYKYLGIHGKSGKMGNTMYLEAYNAIWNFRAKNRSPELSQRTRLAAALAPAFWPASRFEHVVPDFDQAVIDGEIAVDISTNGLLPVGRYPGGTPGTPETTLTVNGIGVSGTAQSTGSLSVRKSDGTTASMTGWNIVDPAVNSLSAGEAQLYVKAVGGASTYPDIKVDLTNVFAELAEGGVKVSLASLDLARKTQAFARIREKYQELDEEYIIDLLMDGITIPDKFLTQPILIADQTVRFGQVKRYATDSGNLAESAVSGGAMVDLRLRVPQLNTGGIIMIVAECVPEQLFERQEDPFNDLSDPATLPEFVRDTLDPEKVDIVTNGEIDVRHSSPNATFGYAPLNWKWTSAGPRVGGKFFRPTTDPATDTVRQRLWALEKTDPVLGPDFYIVQQAPHMKPFLESGVDPFEVTVTGGALIDGNTVFGGVLVEATSNYQEVLDKAPTERIEK